MLPVLSSARPRCDLAGLLINETHTLLSFPMQCLAHCCASLSGHMTFGIFVACKGNVLKTFQLVFTNPLVRTNKCGPGLHRLG